MVAKKAVRVLDIDAIRRKRRLNGDLEETFRHWYPAFRGKTEAKAA